VERELLTARVKDYIYQRRSNNTLTVRTILGRIFTLNSHVFWMRTIMLTPASAAAVTNEVLYAQAAEVIKPYTTSAIAVNVRCSPANTSAITTWTLSLLHTCGWIAE